MEDCKFCKYLEKGDTLYEFAESTEGDILFSGVEVKYCPVCGRELSERYQQRKSNRDDSG